LVVVGWFLFWPRVEIPSTGRSQDLVLIPAGVVNSVGFSPDSRRILTAVSQSGMSALLWDAETGALVSTFWIAYDPGASSAAFSPDGRLIVTATGRNALLWNAENGRLSATLSGHKGNIACVAFSGDGRRVVTASADTTARIWHVEPGASEFRAPAITLVGHQKEVSGATFSPDGRRVLTSSRLDHSVRLWDTETGKPLLSLVVNGEVLSAEFAADGRRILLASSDGKMHLHDAETGEALLELDGGFGLWRATFSPDGRRIVSTKTSSRGHARLWDAYSGQPVMVLAGHSDWVTSAAFSPDGRRIVTASADKTARLWDADTAQPLATLAGHEATVWGATFSPNGRRIVTRAADGAVRVWQILAQPPYHDPSAVPLVKLQVPGLGEWIASRYEAARRWLVGGR
jgi:WD40 repeat protein